MELVEAREPMAAVNQVLRQLGTRRRETKRGDADYDSDDEDDHPKPATTTNVAKPVV